MYYVYLMENDINDKKYIGFTKNIVDRKKQHLRYLKGNYHHNRKLQEAYNELNFKLNFTVLAEFENEEDGYNCEIENIIKFDSKNNGYNCNDGGKSNKGYVQSDYAKQVASEVHSKKLGELNSFYGKTHSEESRKKISEALKGKLKGIAKSEEQKRKMKENNARSKKVEIDGFTYISMTDAEEKVGISRKKISKMANDKNVHNVKFVS